MQNNLVNNLQGNQPTSMIATNSNQLFNDSATNKGLFWVIKIILLFTNAFTGMIGIFIVLFGFSYPEEMFPGDLRGKTCALISIVYIGWTLIGYCGAHHQNFSFLLVYSGLVVFYVLANIIIFGVLASKPWLDVNLFWIMCAYFTILMAIGLLHAYQIKLKEERNDDPLTYSYPNFTYGSTIDGYPITQQMQLPITNQIQTNFASQPLDSAQMYHANSNYANNYLNIYPQMSDQSSSRGMNYFQRNWNRLSSKRMNNFFNRSSTYRPNSNVTEMKPISFNTSTIQPF